MSVTVSPVPLGSKGQSTLQILDAHCKTDNPLSEIDEPNVFSGAVGFGPDWPHTIGTQTTDCDSQQMKNLRKTYEIGEPNFEAWHEFEPDYNVFPFTAGKSGPDAPQNSPGAENVDLFDGHGGIIGLEDRMHWIDTPSSAAPKEQGKYADSSSNGMDYNVLANGYKFPEY